MLLGKFESENENSIQVTVECQTDGRDKWWLGGETGCPMSMLTLSELTDSTIFVLFRNDFRLLIRVMGSVNYRITFDGTLGF